MTHTTNNPGDIDFDLRQETREAGLVYRMYRNQNSIFVEVSLPISPESNDRILRSFFMTVTPGRLHEAPKQLRKKAREELAVYNASEEDILIIASHVSAEIPNNIDKLRDLETKENKSNNKNNKRVHTGKDNWGRDEAPDFSKFNHNQILEMRGTKYVSYANKVTKTRIPADDPILTKLSNLKNLSEDERWQLYEAFEQVQFRQQNKILYEAVVFKSSNADVNDDRLTEEIADKPSPPAGAANDSKTPGVVFLEDAERYVTKFVYYDPDSDSFKAEDFVMKDDKPVFPVPTSGASSIPYEFVNIEHLNMFYKHKVSDNQTTITSLFEESLGIFKHFNKQPRAVTIVWSAAMVVSHLTDLFPVIPYFGGIGIPGSGKSSMAETALFCSYRGMKLTNPNAAQATRVFGNTEPGQYTLVVDEADKIDKDSDFMPMLKDGYMWTARFQKVNPVSMLLEYFYPFGMKFWFAEERPEEWKSAGFYERTFIHDTKKPILRSRDPNVKDLGCQLSLSRMNQFKKSQILNFRKKALLYRMRHFNDPLLDLDINVTGRHRELTLPFLQLFYGTARQKDTEWAIQSLLDDMSNLKRNSLSMELCIRISKYLYDKKTNKLRIKDFWEELKDDQDFGDYKKDGKKDWIESADYGEITTKKIATEVKNNYKAVFKHGRTGNEWRIDIDAIIGRAQTYLYDKTKIKTTVIADSREGCEGCEGFFEGEADNFFKTASEEDADEDIPKATLEKKLIDLWAIVQKLEQDNQQTREESESTRSKTKDGASQPANESEQQTWETII